MLSEVMAVGRAGSLVIKAGQGVVVQLYRAEEITDWKVDADGVLAGISLGGGGARPPFIFHGPSGSGPDLEGLPLADLIAASLDHYRLDPDYKHALHFAALPTAWVCGFDKPGDLRVGSCIAWTSETPGATAGFLEFTGAGIQFIERALDRVERRMALLGARMPDRLLADGETPVPAEPQRLTGLVDVVRSVNESLTRVLELAFRALTGAEAQPGQITFALNTALEPPRVSGSDLTAVVSAWREGAISKDTMLDYLRRHEVLPDGRTVAEERQKLLRS